MATQNEQPGPDLRHHPARWRAVTRRQPHELREARDRPPTRPSRRRCHRGRIPGGESRRSRSRPPDRRRNRNRGWSGDRRSGPRPSTRHRQGLGSRPAGRQTADPHLHRHLRSPPRAQAQDEPIGGRRSNPEDGGPRQVLLPGHRVQLRGRRAIGPGLSHRGLHRRHRIGRHDPQHPGHGRLHLTGGVLRAHQPASRRDTGGRRA